MVPPALLLRVFPESALPRSIRITVHDDGTWAYEEDTVLMIQGQTEPFHHVDKNRLTRVAAPTPNPLARR